MFKILFPLLAIISQFAFSAQSLADDPAEIVIAESVRSGTYRSAQGPIDIAKLTSVLAKGLCTQHFVITNMRWSYRPSDYVQYYATRPTLNGPVAKYVIDFVVSGQHKGQCEMRLAVGAKKARISDCAIGEQGIVVSETVDFAAIGLTGSPQPQPQPQQK